MKSNQGSKDSSPSGNNAAAQNIKDLGKNKTTDLNNDAAVEGKPVAKGSNEWRPSSDTGPNVSINTAKE